MVGSHLIWLPDHRDREENNKADELLRLGGKGAEKDLAKFTLTCRIDLGELECAHAPSPVIIRLRYSASPLTSFLDSRETH